MEFRISEVRDSFFCNLLSELNKKHSFFRKIPKKRLDIACARGYIMVENAYFPAF